jgi:CRISPR/Cas system-associated endonuclease Cas1
MKGRTTTKQKDFANQIVSLGFTLLPGKMMDV